MQTVQWEHYPQVAHNPATRAFIEELAQVRKSPSTIDNYSRDLEDFLQAVSEIPFSDVLEADETLIARYVDGLWSRPAHRGSGHNASRDKITYVTGSKLSLNTIRRRESRDPGLLRLVHPCPSAAQLAQPCSQRCAWQRTRTHRVCPFGSLDSQREPICRSAVVRLCSHVPAQPGADPGIVRRGLAARGGDLSQKGSYR